MQKEINVKRTGAVFWAINSDVEFISTTGLFKGDVILPEVTSSGFLARLWKTVPYRYAKVRCLFYMNKFFTALIVSGIVLVIIAIVSATTIPIKTEQDFSKYIERRGGSITHSPTFPETYMLASTIARSVRNFWIGSTGLLLLAAGLAGKINYSSQLPTSSRAQA